MTEPVSSVLVVGATGSVGRHVVDEAVASGYRVRVLTRREDARFPPGVEVVRGDLTDPGALPAAVDAVDAIVFTHGARSGATAFAEVDYGGVRNVLLAVGARPVRIALMSAIWVTDPPDSFGGPDSVFDWKRRSERLVRASGHRYTIVRPSWFDRNDDDQHRLQLLQGDTRRTGTLSDGVIARRQIAQVLVAALTTGSAAGTTFELAAEQGPAQSDLAPLFAALEPDTGIDGVRDAGTLPVDAEPSSVRRDLDSIRAQRAGSGRGPEGGPAS